MKQKKDVQQKRLKYKMFQIAREQKNKINNFKIHDKQKKKRKQESHWQHKRRENNGGRGETIIKYLLHSSLHKMVNLDTTFKDQFKKKIVLQAKVCKEYIKEYLVKIDVFKLSGPY